MALINERQREFLVEQGQRYGAEAFRKAEEGVQWFEPYFDSDIAVLTEGGIDTYTYQAYWQEYVPWLTEQLREACDDREMYHRLYQEGLLPPHVGTYLCEPPDWMDNWQAEQAFREGYHDAFDGEVFDEIKRRLSALKGKRAGIAMLRETADEIRDVDPYAAQVLDELIDEAEGSGTWGTKSLDDVLVAMAEARDSAYRSFAPGEPPKGRSGFEFLGLRGARKQIFRFLVEEAAGRDAGAVWYAEAEGRDFDEALGAFFDADYADYLAEAPDEPFSEWLYTWRDLHVREL